MATRRSYCSCYLYRSFKEGEEESSELDITLDEDGRVCSQEGADMRHRT